MFAGYVAVQVNHIHTFPWWKVEAGEPFPIDAATNYVACVALALHGCFCIIFFAAIAAILGRVGPSTSRKWITSDANFPYHIWLVVGSVALSLDYAAVLMFTSPRWPFTTAFMALYLPSTVFVIYSVVRTGHPLTSANAIAHISPHSRCRRWSSPYLAHQVQRSSRYQVVRALHSH